MLVLYISAYNECIHHKEQCIRLGICFRYLHKTSWIFIHLIFIINPTYTHTHLLMPTHICCFICYYWIVLNWLNFCKYGMTTVFDISSICSFKISGEHYLWLFSHFCSCGSSSECSFNNWKRLPTDWTCPLTVRLSRRRYLSDDNCFKKGIPLLLFLPCTV